MYCRYLLRAGGWWPLLFGFWVANAMAAECVGVVTAGSTAFWRQVEIGARQAGTDNGVVVHIRGPKNEGSVQSQLQMIDWVLERGCRILVIAPSGDAVAKRVNQLSASGISTIYFDRDMPGSLARGFVATDNFRAGEQAGRYLAQVLNGRGKVALLRLRPGLSSTTERELGFRQAVEAGGLQVLLDAYVGDDRHLAEQALHEYLEQLDAIFTPNSISTRNALAALRRLNRSGQLLHVGFDGDPLLLDALLKGEIHSLFIQQGSAIGYQSVSMAAQALRGELPAERVSVALEVERVGRDNLVQWQKAQLQRSDLSH